MDFVSMDSNKLSELVPKGVRPDSPILKILGTIGAEYLFFLEVSLALIQKEAHKDIGNHGVLLVNTIDYKQCQENTLTVRIWNDELAKAIGVRSSVALIANRSKCVESGWIEYANHGQRQPGEYRVKITG